MSGCRSITVCQGSISVSLRLLYGASRISKNTYGRTTVGHDWCRSSKNATTNDYGGATVHHDISRFPCSPVGTHVVFTQDIVQFVCLLYTLSQFVQLEKCVGSLMGLPFPLCSHYPLIDRWSSLGTWFVSSYELGAGLRLAGGCEHCFRFPFPAPLDATGFFFVGILNAEAILITWCGWKVIYSHRQVIVVPS